MQSIDDPARVVETQPSEVSPEPVPEPDLDPRAADGAAQQRRKRRRVEWLLGALCIGLIIGIVLLLVYESSSSESKYRPTVWDGVEHVDIVVVDAGRPGRATAIVKQTLANWPTRHPEDRVVVYTLQDSPMGPVTFDPSVFTDDAQQAAIHVVPVSAEHVTAVGRGGASGADVTAESQCGWVLAKLLSAEPNSSTSDRVFIFLGDATFPVKTFDPRNRFVFRLVEKRSKRWYRRFTGAIGFDHILFEMHDFERTWPVTPFKYGEMGRPWADNDDVDMFWARLSTWLADSDHIVFDPTLGQDAYITDTHNQLVEHCRGSTSDTDQEEDEKDAEKAFKSCYVPDTLARTDAVFVHFCTLSRGLFASTSTERSQGVNEHVLEIARQLTSETST